MVKITVKLNNRKEIMEAFEKAPVKVVKEIGRAINRIILKIESTAKREAPVNKKSGGGNLRQSIRSKMNGVASGIVEVGAEYAIFVHEGTKPHIIRIKNKKVLAEKGEKGKKYGRVFGTFVKHPGTEANPFLQRAVDNKEAFIKKEFSKAIDKALKNFK